MAEDKFLIVGLGEAGCTLFEILNENGRFAVYGCEIDETKIEGPLDSYDSERSWKSQEKSEQSGEEYDQRKQVAASSYTLSERQLKLPASGQKQH